MKLRQFRAYLNLTGVLLIMSCANYSNPLASPSISVTGTGQSSAASGLLYLFADSTGAVATSGNSLQVSFSDSDLPLGLISYSEAFSEQLNSGSCSSLGALIPNISGDVVSTSFSATGCTDQTTLTVYLDTSDIYDQSGFNGQSLIYFSLIIDLAPKVTAAATGNTAIDGSGTTESSAGVFTLTGNLDSSIVVTFSKNLASGNLNATLSGCAATLGTPNLVTSSNGITVAWPLGNLAGVSVGQSCTINVSGVTDAAGNPDDPSDPNISMNFTFH